MWGPEGDPGRQVWRRSRWWIYTKQRPSIWVEPSSFCRCTWSPSPSPSNLFFFHKVNFSFLFFFSFFLWRKTHWSLDHKSNHRCETGNLLRSAGPTFGTQGSQRTVASSAPFFFSISYKRKLFPKIKNEWQTSTRTPRITSMAMIQLAREEGWFGRVIAAWTIRPKSFKAPAIDWRMSISAGLSALELPLTSTMMNWQRSDSIFN